MSPGCILSKKLCYQEWDGQTDRQADRGTDDNTPSAKGLKVDVPGSFSPM